MARVIRIIWKRLRGEPIKSEELQVPYTVFGQFQANDAAIVEMHRGALGIPWLGGVRKGR